MNKFFSITLITSFFILNSCNYNQKSYTISGKLKNSKGQDTLIVDLLEPSSVQAIDTVISDKTGNFSFDFDVSERGFYRLRLKNYPKDYIILSLDSSEKVKLNIDFEHFATNYELSGSKESENMKELFSILNRTNWIVDSLKIRYSEASNLPGQDTLIPILQQSYENTIKDYKQKIKSFIKKHLGEFATLAAIEHLNPETNIDLYLEVLKNLKDKYSNSKYFKAFEKRVNSLKKLAIGMEAPEIILKNPDGKEIALSSLRGKYVILDFWASWCKPCRRSNPKLLEIYKKYKDKGLDIYSVSLDKNKEEWIKAIKDDGLIWNNHVSDLMYWNSPVVKLYKIEGIPNTFLIDKEGKIIAKNLNLKQLEDKLDKLFKNKS